MTSSTRTSGPGQGAGPDQQWPAKLLVKGNTKLGPNVWTWSLTPGRTCPGASALCRGESDDLGACYAERGRYAMPSVRDALRARADMVDQAPDLFECRMLEELRRLRAGSVVRIHVAGDFHRAAYVWQWVRLAAANPDLRFYAYTRSWTVPEMLPALDALRALPNVTVWASWDYTMPDVPAGWLVAGLHSTLDQARAAGGAVCPGPGQLGRVPDCGTCGLCPRGAAGGRVRFFLHSVPVALVTERATAEAAAS